jgi:hypothetical protein
MYLMYRVTKRLSDMSRRSLVLFSIGLVWVGYGFAVFTATPGEIAQRTGHPALPVTQLLTIRWSGALWLVLGSVGIIVSTLRRRLHLHDAWGFNALLLPPLLWSLLSAWSYIAYLITGGGVGNQRGWVAFLVWAAMAVWVFITASWADPEHLRGHPEEQFEGRPDQSAGR